jgi:hypothetical protein
MLGKSMKRANAMSAIVGIWIVGVVPLQVMAAELPVDSEKITQEVRETIAVSRQYMVLRWETFQRKTREELIALQKQLIALRGKAGEASEAARTELLKSIHQAEKKKEVAKVKMDELDKLRAATDATWTDVKTGMNAALDELKHSSRYALSRLP